MLKVAKFTRMIDGDKQDYDFLEKLEREYASKVGERLYTALSQLDNSLSGYQVSRLEHSLQSATRAYRDGADVDWVVSVLIHDLGDIHAPYNHDQYAAVVLAPYVREQCRWVVEKHGIFQRKYYGEHSGTDPDAREQFLDHPCYEDAVYFCENWDQNSFDPAYPNLSLAFFKPLLMEVFARDAFSSQAVQANVRIALHNPSIATQRENAEAKYSALSE